MVRRSNRLSERDKARIKRKIGENPHWGRVTTLRWFNREVRKGKNPITEKMIRIFFNRIKHVGSNTKYWDADSDQSSGDTLQGREVSSDFGRESGCVTVRSLDVKTLEDLLRISDVDLSKWEVSRFVSNSWETTVGAKNSGTGRIETLTNYQVKAFFSRKEPEHRAIETLLEEMKSLSVTLPKSTKFKNRKSNRMLEVSIFDPHLGLHCFRPGSDQPWSIDKCENVCMETLERLLDRSKPFGPFEYILFPLGNDFLHSDYIFGSTTAGTRQPEADAWHEIYVRGEKLLIAMLDRLKKVAPLKVLTIPGNHSRHSEFTLGRVINAYYHNDKNVIVDASANPYKFEHYGKNLIGFEHGHSVAQVRLAALMANECRDIWHLTSYREWHLGDQHRKGSAKPSMLEEQGVSVDYLPGLTPPNEWHRLKSYNWQKRGAMGFVWDKNKGQYARMTVNIDSYTGDFME